jgi:hypothetical protein
MVKPEKPWRRFVDNFAQFIAFVTPGQIRKDGPALCPRSGPGFANWPRNENAMKEENNGTVPRASGKACVRTPLAQARARKTLYPLCKATAYPLCKATAARKTGQTPAGGPGTNGSVTNVPGNKIMKTPFPMAAGRVRQFGHQLPAERPPPNRLRSTSPQMA